MSELCLDENEITFLAARLRRMFSHHKYKLPEFALKDDKALIGIAGSVIGSILSNAIGDTYNPHPSSGAPYDYDDPDTDAILRKERGLAPRQPSGTFDCPICGKGVPHQHSGEEIAKHQGAIVSLKQEDGK